MKIMKTALTAGAFLVLLSACGKSKSNSGGTSVTPQNLNSALDGTYATDCNSLADDLSFKRKVVIGDGTLTDTVSSYASKDCSGAAKNTPTLFQFTVTKARADIGPNAYEVELKDAKGTNQTTAVLLPDGRFMFGDKTNPETGEWDDARTPDGFIEEGLKVVK